MIEFILTFIFLVLVVLAMSIGVLRGRKPIKGTCGGLNNASGVCDLCGGQPENCDKADASSK